MPTDYADFIASKDTIHTTFSGQLRNVRERHGLTQSELANLSGLPASIISHFEIGTRLPALPNLVRLAEALDCSTDELLGRNLSPCVNCDNAVLVKKIRRILDVF